jgi:hypothetical protein
MVRREPDRELGKYLIEVLPVDAPLKLRAMSHFRRKTVITDRRMSANDSRVRLFARGWTFLRCRIAISSVRRFA